MRREFIVDLLVRHVAEVEGGGMKLEFIYDREARPLFLGSCGVLARRLWDSFTNLGYEVDPNRAQVRIGAS